MLRSVLLAVALVGCGGSVVVDDNDAEVEGAGGGTAASVSSSSSGPGSRASAVSSSSATVGAGGVGGAEDPWACHPWEIHENGPDVPVDCGGAEICPAPPGHCPTDIPCVACAFVWAATGACICGEGSSQLDACGPDGTWDCVMNPNLPIPPGQLNEWSCCVPQDPNYPDQ